MFYHQGVGLFGGPVFIKFFFEKSVHCSVQSKRRSIWLACSASTIEVKAPMAVEEVLDLGAAQLVWLGARRCINIPIS